MPYAISVKKDQDYWFCVCGKSGTGLCDGSHEGTGKVPHHYVAPKDDTVYVCGCGQSFESPFCDGTHKTL